jgi:hypothetical protein
MRELQSKWLGVFQVIELFNVIEAKPRISKSFSRFFPLFKWLWHSTKPSVSFFQKSFVIFVNHLPFNLGDILSHPTSWHLDKTVSRFQHTGVEGRIPSLRFLVSPGLIFFWHLVLLLTSYSPLSILQLFGAHYVLELVFNQLAEFYTQTKKSLINHNETPLYN